MNIIPNYNSQSKKLALGSGKMKEPEIFSYRYELEIVKSNLDEKGQIARNAYFKFLTSVSRL